MDSYARKSIQTGRIDCGNPRTISGGLGGAYGLFDFINLGFITQGGYSLANVTGGNFAGRWMGYEPFAEVKISGSIDSFAPIGVPEPATTGLLLLGLLGMAARFGEAMTWGRFRARCSAR